MTTEVIIITLVNLAWGYVWFEVGRWIGRKKKYYGTKDRRDI